MQRKRCIDCNLFAKQKEGYHVCFGGDILRPITGIDDKKYSKYYGRFNRCPYFIKKENK